MLRFSLFRPWLECFDLMPNHIHHTLSLVIIVSAIGACNRQYRHPASTAIPAWFYLRPSFIPPSNLHHILLYPLDNRPVSTLVPP
jgi:hypothetical protein